MGSDDRQAFETLVLWGFRGFWGCEWDVTTVLRTVHCIALQLTTVLCCAAVRNRPQRLSFYSNGCLLLCERDGSLNS